MSGKFAVCSVRCGWYPCGDPRSLGALCLPSGRPSSGARLWLLRKYESYYYDWLPQNFLQSISYQLLATAHCCRRNSIRWVQCVIRYMYTEEKDESKDAVFRIRWNLEPTCSPDGCAIWNSKRGCILSLFGALWLRKPPDLPYKSIKKRRINFTMMKLIPWCVLVW